MWLFSLRTYFCGHPGFLRVAQHLFMGSLSSHTKVGCILWFATKKPDFCCGPRVGPRGLRFSPASQLLLMQSIPGPCSELHPVVAPHNGLHVCPSFIRNIEAIGMNPLNFLYLISKLMYSCLRGRGVPTTFQSSFFSLSTFLFLSLSLDLAPRTRPSCSFLCTSHVSP